MLARFLCIFCYITLFLMGYSSAYAQYQPLQSKGKIPQDVLISADENYWKEVNRISKKEGNMRKKVQKQFYLNNAYELRELMTSGKILFGDSVSQYLNDFADKLLQKQPDLRQKIRFYTVKSSAINALTSPNGVILVNIGLLAHVRNEAELALILCHEITHYAQQHSLKIYLESQGLEDKQGGIFHRLSLEDRMLSQNLYSQQTEYEADSIGLQLFFETAYNFEEAIKVFDLMQENYPLFGNVSVDIRDFETENIRLENAELDSIYQYNALDKKAPSSHPEAEIRKKKLLELAQKYKVKTQSINSKSTYFEKIQRLCRYEYCRIEMENRHYELAIYNALYLQKTEKNPNEYLDEIIAYSLYAFAKYLNSGRFWDIHADYQALPPSLQPLCYMMENIEGQQLSAIALQRLWKCYLNHAENVVWARACENLAQDIPKYFPNDKKEIQTYLGKSAGMSFFTNVLNADNESFKIIPVSDEKQIAKQQRKYAHKGVNLGIDSIVFIDPVYQRFNYRMKQPEDYFGGDVMEQGLVDKILEYSKQLKLNCRIIRSNDLTIDDVLIYNELSLLHDWFAVQRPHPEGFDLVNFRQPEMDKIVKHLGTPYFAWTGGVGISQPRQHRNRYLAMSPLIIPLYYYFTPEYETIYYTQIYNLQTGKYIVKYPRKMRLNDQADMFHSVIYDIVFQIKHK
jgi:hypothetical protein